MDLSNQSKMLRLQELDKIKDNILATVSHDLKNPINSICNFLDIIHDNILSKKVID
jgi:K+-sensing histidine kinase KdpD